MTGARLVAALRQEARRVAALPPWRRNGAARLPGDRYSRRVALLKRVLPALAVGLLLLVAAWPRLSPLLAIRLPGIDLREARELKMVDPRYAGVDRQNRPFVVTAATGRQVPDRRDLLSLDSPKATMTLRHGAKLTLTAATGVYQAQAQLLDLTKNVTLTRQDGTRFVTDRAHIDFTHNAAEGGMPVTGHGPAGDIRAQGFRILNRGDTVIFTGKSQVALKSTHAATVATAPPTLPAAVDEAAARLAVAARTPAPPPAAAPVAAAKAPPEAQKPVVAADHGRHVGKAHPRKRTVAKAKPHARHHPSAHHRRARQRAHAAKRTRAPRKTGKHGAG